MLILLLAVTGFTQSTDDRSADEIVRTYNQYAMKQDWSGVAALIHPDSLSQFRIMLNLMTEKNPGMLSLFGIKSKKEFSELSNAQVFEKLFAYVRKSSPEAASAMNSMNTAILGAVDEIPDLRHYVFRTTFSYGDTSISIVDLYSLKRVGESWRVIMKDGEMEALMTALSKTPPPPKPKGKATKRKSN